MKVKARILLIVLSIILVLAMVSCKSEKSTCTSCKGSGLATCPVVLAYANYFGERPTGHDCNKCTNGTTNCDRCNGTGKIAND